MISKLMNQERPCEEPEYSKALVQIGELREKLWTQLNPEGQDLLEQLLDMTFHRESVSVESVFTEGFCTAIEMMLEVYRHLRQ